ncbi:unnamed protein product [Mytilus coruscus]|uniref:Uncharacterized protein n=1 Tax=Mytilus coruscus TaxID=42192 RepID=A0A6J8EQU2_MYTCO|nr:unnamed protein product [Mytilus coruscus]
MLNFLFHRITKYMTLPTDISSCYKGLAIMQLLLNSESSSFIIDACKYYYAKISQNVAQLLPPSSTIGETYNIRKCYQRHLRDGIKTDVVLWWLLYASFYYITGQFNITLKLTDYILSRCSPDMTFVGIHQNCNVHKNNYRQNVHSSMTLNDKMKIATVTNATYLKDLSLIPEELPLNVYEDGIYIPPVVMSHCIRFLCYYHLGNIFNREQALRDLYLTVKTQYFIEPCKISESLAILGICYEISGARDTAYQCYEAALQCDDRISSTAEIRKSKLDGN